MVALGLVILIIGFWGMFTWPLPGSYNILFFDVYTLFGLIVLGFGLSVLARFRLQYVGVLSLVSGGIVIAYGARAYQLGLTSTPWAMFLMYLGWGATAILAFPVAVIADGWLQGSATAASAPEPPRGPDGRPRYPVSYLRAAIVLFFVLVIVLSALATAGILGNAIYSHLLKAP